LGSSSGRESRKGKRVTRASQHVQTQADCRTPRGENSASSCIAVGEAFTMLDLALRKRAASAGKVRFDRLLSLKTVCIRILRSVENFVVSMYWISSLHFSGLRTVVT